MATEKLAAQQLLDEAAECTAKARAVLQLTEAKLYSSGREQLAAMKSMADTWAHLARTAAIAAQTAATLPTDDDQEQ